MYRLLLIALAVLAFSCSKEKTAHRPSKKAFYYWQTSFYNFYWGDSTYRALDIDRLYCRFFDVDWSDEAKAPVPVSPIEMYYSTLPDSVEFVPVVFITNETFKNLDEKTSAELAANVHKKVMMQLTPFLVSSFRYEDGWWEQNPYNMKSKDLRSQTRYDSVYNARLKKIREVQFDCDWTKSTRDKYFAFLKEAKKLFKDQTVTSTVRLYQYKYPKEAGLPPVDRGMLMCYNAGKVNDDKTINSVFDKSEILDYLDADDYPIPLDYALPVFEWAVWFQGDKFNGILPIAPLKEDYSSFIENTKNNIWTVKEDFVLGNTASASYLRRGDQIRFESPSAADIKTVAQWLSEHKNNQEAAITFYHLNENDLQEHSQTIKSIFDSF